MTHWAFDSIFYHIYPLGLCGAPARNDFKTGPVPRLQQLHGWIGHLKQLGVNAVYLGPLFESTAHGYDTADYYHVDRRLGDNRTLAQLTAAFHENGLRVILDGVFNHVGRDFWAFCDLRRNLTRSPYRDWFQGINFAHNSPYQDPFAYDTWRGFYDLVKLNLRHPEVKQHLLGAVEQWIREFRIDGLRLDVADAVDISFLKELAAFCRKIRPDFWLVGEVIHGDYRKWANRETLDSVTNYVCYKGLFSSHVDRNYFEIAYTLDQQFGEGGLYSGLPLYNFADNHDVNRVASALEDQQHLYPLYCLLFTIPGVPSIYYGSEWGLEGKRNGHGDAALRPALDLASAPVRSPHPDLARTLAHLAHIRRNSRALRYGGYQQLKVAHQQFAFARQTPDEYVVVAVNAADRAVPLNLTLPITSGRKLVDLLNPEESFPIFNRKVQIDALYPHWGRIMRVAP